MPTPNGHAHRVSTVAFAVLVALAMVPLQARAQATPPKVFYACYVPAVGTVYRIKEPGLSEKCFGPTSGPFMNVQFSWTDGANGLHVGDAAGGDLGGAFPNPSVTKLQGAAVSATTPTSGQVLAFDGSAWTATTPATATGTSANTPNTLVQRDANGDFAAGALTLAGKLDQSSQDGFVSRGNYPFGSIPATGGGARLMWYPRKAALRAGLAYYDEWDDPNVGIGSVATGYRTTASGNYSTALGEVTRATGSASTALGSGTTASGLASTAIGYLTTASGPFSIAIGYLASTDGHEGSFVFSDNSTFSTVASTADHQFVVRASGGTIFYSNSALSAGVSLAPGAGAWASVSDVRKKENFRDVRGEMALEKIARMSIREWNYKAQPASIRHLGPTAQDFRAAFGLGESDTTITTTDIDGVNLIAAQALEKRTRDLREDNTALREELAKINAAYVDLKREHDDLMRRVARLEARSKP